MCNAFFTKLCELLKSFCGQSVKQLLPGVPGGLHKKTLHRASVPALGSVFLFGQSTWHIRMSRLASL